ncbi:Ribonuclease 3 [Gracilariopsis chorda]|uniref:Ribonuclease 3 n=1 Tax=Gracilariopsis chorda TaxID=448386 RepID=A0A2V3IHE6_9FLOR|nr:Ribonuclease 3 [Gracilariopsis chorda]|eukprot:PXF41514.1 Ribonuclease 3 [Gracilariopsis chorda]
MLAAAFATAFGVIRPPRAWRTAADSLLLAAPPAVVAKRAQPPVHVLSEAQLDRVQHILQHNFRTPALLAHALTHRSVVNASTSRSAFYQVRQQRFEITSNNERLELLGDRVLALIVLDSLFHRDPHTSEGQLSAVSHTLVARKTVHQCCVALGLDAFLLEADALRGTAGSRYGDCFEALLGALFLDGGYQAAHNFYTSRVFPLCQHQLNQALLKPCQKRSLQEHLVRSGLPAPRMGTQLTYVTTNHDQSTRVFTRAINLFGRHVSQGKAPNIQDADQTAAQLLLDRLRRCKPASTTCLLIRLARQANDQYSLEKLQQVRAAQLATGAALDQCSPQPSSPS